MKSLVSVFMLSTIGIGYFEDVGARLNPDVVAALPAAAGVGLIDDFGDSPIVIPAILHSIQDILYTAFAESLMRPAVGNELATLAEAILRTGGAIPVNGLTHATLVAAVGVQAIQGACPLLVIAVNDAILAPGAVVPPAVALAVRNAARSIQQKAAPANMVAAIAALGGGGAPIPVLAAINGPAPVVTRVQLANAAGALGLAAGVISPNPISLLYEHMRDMRHLCNLLPGAVGPGISNAHYLAWCRAARVNTDQQIHPEHLSFTLTAAGPAADFATILGAISTAVQNPNNIISIDRFPVAGNLRFVDILVNVGPIPGINVVKYNQAHAIFPPNIGDGVLEAIACITEAMLGNPAAVAPAALVAPVGAAPFAAAIAGLAPGGVVALAPIAPVQAATTMAILKPGADNMSAQVLQGRTMSANAAAAAVAGVLPIVLAALPAGTASNVIRHAILVAVGAQSVPVANVSQQTKIAAAAAATIQQTTDTITSIDNAAGGILALPITPPIDAGINAVVTPVFLPLQPAAMGVPALHQRI
jgi:hypothetical protein